MKIIAGRKRFSTVIIVMLISAMLLQGCGLFKPTAASLTAKMLKELQKVNSAEVNTKIDSIIGVKVKSIDVGMEMNLGIDNKAEMTKDPERTKENNTLSVSGFGQNVNINYEQYTEKAEDGSKITYVRTEGGKWRKSTAQKQSSEDADGDGGGSADAGSAGSGSGKKLSTLELIGLLQKAGDELKDAELKEELVEINGKEAYQINATVGGNLVKELLLQTNADTGKNGIDLESIDWGSISIPTELYIYKSSNLPARIKMDCAQLGGQILGKVISDKTENTMLEGVDFEFKTFDVDITIDRYDEIGTIEIPQEALDAEEAGSAEELVPDFSNLF